MNALVLNGCCCASKMLKFPGRGFDTLEIDIDFCAMVNSSVYCDVHYINNLLKYISENQKQIRKILEHFLSEGKVNKFLKQVGTSASIQTHNIKRERLTFVSFTDEIPRLSDATARKRFFIFNKENEYQEVGFYTAVAVFGRDTILEKCRELDFLNGIEMNGRAAWFNGLGIQDIDRDTYNSGWCKGDKW